jgi:hypothetical protein
VLLHDQRLKSRFLFLNLGCTLSFEKKFFVLFLQRLYFAVKFLELKRWYGRRSGRLSKDLRKSPRTVGKVNRKTVSIIRCFYDL